MISNETLTILRENRSTLFNFGMELYRYRGIYRQHGHIISLFLSLRNGSRLRKVSYHIKAFGTEDGNSMECEVCNRGYCAIENFCGSCKSLYIVRNINSRKHEV